MRDTLGIYIHIPFCRRKCDYCDFYSLAGREERMDDYQKALAAHIRETAPMARSYQVDTIYFGGGTPSLFGAKRLRGLLGTIQRCFEVRRDAEITVECNPDSADLKLLRELHRAGVGRISLGMQSACDRELAAIHRLHTHSQTVEAVAAVRKAKIKNLSLDLIYGLPEESDEEWRRTVEEAIRLAPEHISCYGLKVEEGTPLAGRAAAGLELPDDDAQADRYLWTVERLAQAGYEQYEISNFARPGLASRHNLKYWMGRPYLGFGPGAHSDFGGRRYSFRRDLEEYIDHVLHGGALIDECESIPPRERGSEYLMLRLRTGHGIEEWEYRRQFLMNFEPIEQKLITYERQGWAQRREGRWRLTPQGFLVSNQLIGALLEVQERAALADTLPILHRMPPEEDLGR